MGYIRQYKYNRTLVSEYIYEIAIKKLVMDFLSVETLRSVITLI